MKKQIINKNSILIVLLGFAVLLSNAFSYSPSYSKYVISRTYGISISSVSSYPLNGVYISGTVRVGQTLSASVNPAGATATYRWLTGPTASGPFVEIPAATLNTYTLLASDLNKYIRVEATGTGIYSGIAVATTGSVGSALTPIASIAINTIEPLHGQIRIYSLTGTHYTAQITWTPDDTTPGNKKFKNGTVYQAVIVITPEDGYSVTSTTTITVSGATSVSITYGTNTATVTAIFPST